jgi:hypothetical protein
MTITSLGEVSIGAAMPGAVAALNLALPDAQARLDALLAFQPGAISFQANLVLAAQIVAATTAAISAGVTPPSLSAQIAIVLGLLAPLRAQIAAIAAFQAQLGAGVYAYKYDGNTSTFGSELGAALGGHPPGEQSTAIVLGATSVASARAMAAVFVGF